MCIKIIENTTDNLKIQDTYLDNLGIWATPNKYGIAIDDTTTTIHDELYLIKNDNFGCITQDTMPQLLSLTDKTNNKFYMNPILKIS